MQLEQSLAAALHRPVDGLKALDRADAKASLKDFVRLGWPVVEPVSPLVWGWHLDVICEHLEAVSRGQIRRLIINVPPRHMKSLAVSVFWPAWEWGPRERPALRWLFSSYAQSLSIRDSVKCRRLIQSAWYQERWGDAFVLTSDQNEKLRYDNDHTGVRLATSVDGATTGEGGDILVVDDPHNVKKDVFSEKRMEAVRDWWDQSMSTRLNDPQTGAVVIIMQRVHAKDLTGHILAQNLGYEHLCLPCRYEVEERSRTSLVVKDPRTEPRELIWPERFPEDEVVRIERSLGSYGTAAQLQQRPSPLGGGLIKLKWFQRYGELPIPGLWVRVAQFWDTAQKSDELLNAPWVCGTWVETKTGLYLVDVYRRWMDYPDGKRAVVSLAKKWHPSAVVIEDKSTGSSLLQEIPKIERLPLVPFKPEGDKITRLAVESPAVEAGLVWLPATAGWLPEFEAEIEAFPNSATMDQADMLSMALKYFREGPGKVPPGLRRL
ncbi:MAG: terminase [Desulforudis sp.]|nr:MAG: terminase [Desulforudis sp.]